MRVLAVNVDAVLVQVDDLTQVQALFASLKAEPLEDVEEIVPGARTVLLKFRRGATIQEALQAIHARPLRSLRESTGKLVDIPVVYDGDDLAEVAEMTGLEPAEVVRRHAAGTYTVAFTGFAPGFAYLTGGDPLLHVPRRATPRTRIPAGAVGLAGPFSGVYPQDTPGGWQIIGRTPVAMWDISRERPALLQPGDTVRFVPVEVGAEPSAPCAPPIDVPESGANVLEVALSGLQALFQDLGRTGFAGQGVSASGAMDRAAFRAANRLVGNDAAAVGIEVLGGGFELVAHCDAVLAVTGAQGEVTVSSATGKSRAVPRYAAFPVGMGDRVLIGEPRAGVRSYIAARGGFRVKPFLGSRATDTLARIGPPPIRRGHRLVVNDARSAHVVAAVEPSRQNLPVAGSCVPLDIVIGPRSDWFSAEALHALCNVDWSVTHEADRVGIRLASGTPLRRTAEKQLCELPSEAVLRGSIQVPPSGQPLVFMADHPLTGGYPVIASVATYHLDLASQLPVGALVRFRPREIESR
jgi:KipI family sensor histidine kinase inhibitor